MTSPTYLLPYADLSWVDTDTPYAPQFGDIYWSRGGGGLAEKQHVFIDGNDLQQRWSTLKAGDQFTILETGFGFGLNFSLAVKLWQSITSCEKAILQYVSFEQYPVSPADLRRLDTVLNSSILRPLLSCYPLPISGTHQIWIGNNICLTLVLGDINKTLPDIAAEVDACFLDGFSPAGNDKMWTSDLFSLLAGLMRPGATFSTYSVAAVVRQGLTKAGFNHSKATGYGQKAEMLRGTKPQRWIAKTSKHLEQVTIIGAGLAGICCALALQRRGIRYALYEAEAHPLGAVAQINQLALYPQLTAKAQLSSLFSLQAFEYFRRHFSYRQSGRIQLLRNAREKRRAANLKGAFPEDMLESLTASEASELAGVTVSHDCLYYPTAGWIDPREFYDRWALSAVFNTPIDRIEKHNSAWILISGERQVDRTGVLILATGAVPQTYLSPIKQTRVRGQCLSLKGQPGPRLIMSADVSWFPDNHGSNTVSATFSRDDPFPETRQQDSLYLIRKLQELSRVNSQNHQAFVGFRSTTRDRMPVVGPVPDWQALDEFCTGRQKAPFNRYQPGLFCAVGFGSHGLTHAPYCAEYLVRQINREPVSLIPGLSATRFAMRDRGIRPRTATP